MQEPPARAECPECGRETALTTKGGLRPHSRDGGVHRIRCQGGGSVVPPRTYPLTLPEEERCGAVSEDGMRCGRDKGHAGRHKIAVGRWSD